VRIAIGFVSNSVSILSVRRVHGSSRDCDLRVEDVDLNGSIISVRRSAWEGGEQTPKTKNAVRKIGIDAELVSILREHMAQRKIGVVLRAKNENPLRESNILRRQLHPVLKRLGIPKCGLHAFRHGRVSFLVENNVSLPMISPLDRSWQ
jgi:integrase